MRVEPFPHISLQNARTVITDFNEYNQKIYFGEWFRQLTKDQIFATNEKILRDQLKAYVMGKGLKEPEVEKVNPALN